LRRELASLCDPDIFHSPMNVIRSNFLPTRRGPAEWFTGTVWIENLAPEAGPAGVRAARVSFEPGARTAWHSHPAGQTLHILSGGGWVQRAGAPAVAVLPGDSVWFAPGERHWHGAGPNCSMVHLAVQAEPDGRQTEWFEKVSDQEYQNCPN
jgi:quercetin dioxygenase-like cupin family protein